LTCPISCACAPTRSSNKMPLVAAHSSADGPNHRFLRRTTRIRFDSKRKNFAIRLGNGKAPGKDNQEFAISDILSHSPTGYRGDSRQMFVSAFVNAWAKARSRSTEFVLRSRLARFCQPYDAGTLVVSFKTPKHHRPGPPAGRPRQLRDGAPASGRSCASPWSAAHAIAAAAVAGSPNSNGQGSGPDRHSTRR
jgi:hypothetical protein